MRQYHELVFRVKKPCPNCPFRKQGGIPLRKGRLASIIRGLLKTDTANFHCHKTVYSGRPTPPAQCAGSLIYLEKLGRPNLLMRLGTVHHVYDRAAFMRHAELIIDPKEQDHVREL